MIKNFSNMSSRTPPSITKLHTHWWRASNGLPPRRYRTSHEHRFPDAETRSPQCWHLQLEDKQKREKESLRRRKAEQERMKKRAAESAARAAAIEEERAAVERAAKEADARGAAALKVQLDPTPCARACARGAHVATVQTSHGRSFAPRVAFCLGRPHRTRTPT